MLRWQNRNFESKRWSWQLTMGHLFGRFPSGASVAQKHRTTKWQVCTPQSSTPARTVTRCVLGCTLTEMAWERTHTCPSSLLLWEVSHQLLFLQKIHKQENVHPADMHDEAGIVQLGVYYMFFVSWIFDECITNKSPFFFYCQVILMRYYSGRSPTAWPSCYWTRTTKSTRWTRSAPTPTAAPSSAPPPRWTLPVAAPSLFLSLSWTTQVWPMLKRTPCS